MPLSLPPGTRLVAATHNPGKARELAALLEGRFDVVSAGELGLAEPAETETTFMGNAILKARAAAQASGLVALADDSGLSVRALDGAPGIFSARWAGPEKDFGHAMKLVEMRLADTGREDRQAWFTCALAVCWPSGTVAAVEGIVEGKVTFPPKGDKGFGYDPIFVPEGWAETFGQMDPAAKDALSHRTRAFEALKAALFCPGLAPSGGPPPLAVYIHWPYCARICPYCDFNVVRARGRTDEEAALARAIVADLRAKAGLTGPRTLTSVFFGGGTPSLMRPTDVETILDTARALWAPATDLEISLEANPTDAESGRFADLAAAGVNRLSLGLQSLDDAALAFLGRNHDAAQGRRAVDAALRAAPRLSVDLIYARPGQTVAAWEAELRTVAGLGAEHVSPYQLTIEPGTAFGRARRRGALVPPPEDLAADLYDATQSVLEGLGFEAYEVSNHARGDAARSRHNLAYWRGWDYVGAGPGAHGRLTVGGVRHATEGSAAIGAYIATSGPLMTPLTPLEAAEERLLMGLRTLEGVPLRDLAVLGLDPARLAAFEADGLIRREAGRLVATAPGRLLLDRLTAELIT